ncbi:uncharacterized protein LOC133888524 isoform X2 [Phragmites australis]|uniref:uncharacterized protein LOC133888524 isoform X2 n=1 Tax=Phragmites australis TaxID=29695 RepID=UPI002D783024|nr:uncharacterized protein LOC133888524 isoform X2 [Phragmites australis]
MKPQQNPDPPAPPWTSPRPDMRPPWSLLSPSFSRRAFPAVSEQPCVTLHEWWLARVEGDERKIAVAGFFERNQTIQAFSSAPIAKRHEACTLETEDGIVVFIHGSLNTSRMLANEFPIEVCEKFIIGFPHWWDRCNERYPRTTRSCTGFQPSSSNTTNSQVDSTQFYLEKLQLGKFVDSLASSLMSNTLNNAKSFSDNDDDAFRNSSCLPNGAPRFEEYTYDGDISTNEEAFASNDDCERYTNVSMEMDNVETNLIAGITLRERSHGDIETNVSLAPMVECTNNEGNEWADNTPPISCQKTPVASLKSQGCWKRARRISLNENSVQSNVQSREKPVGPSKGQRSAHEKLQGATRSPITISSVPYAHQSPLTRGRATSLSMSIPESLKLRKTRSGRVMVPRLDAGCQRIVYDCDGSISGVIGLDSPPPAKGSVVKTYVRRKKKDH